MRYSYVAVSPEGKIHKGEIEALSEGQAAEKLREKTLLPLEIKKVHRGRLSFFKWQRRARTQDLLLFTEQLARLLKAGIALDKALKILTQIFSATDRAELEAVTIALRHELEQGRRLSEALAAQGIFPDFYVNLVQAGEASGALEVILEDLGVYLKERQKFQQELLSALLYPSFLLIFGLLAIQTVLVYVLPRFGNIFEEMGVEPPALTRFLIHLGLFWRQWGWSFLLGLAGLFFYFRYRVFTRQNRSQVENWLIKMPLVGHLVLLADLARVSRSLAVMIKGGVPIEKALALSAAVPSLELLRSFFAGLAEEIKRGKSLSILLVNLPGKLGFVHDLVAIGEETGNLAISFFDVASMCEEEVRVATRRLLNLLEPATILFFGLLLGGIIISILVAIFDLQLS